MAPAELISVKIRFVDQSIRLQVPAVLGEKGGGWLQVTLPFILSIHVGVSLHMHVCVHECVRVHSGAWVGWEGVCSCAGVGGCVGWGCARRGVGGVGRGALIGNCACKHARVHYIVLYVHVFMSMSLCPCKGATVPNRKFKSGGILHDSYANHHNEDGEDGHGREPPAQPKPLHTAYEGNHHKLSYLHTRHHIH